MYRLQIVTDVENISLVTGQRLLVNNSIQHALERVFCFFDFPYYLQEGVIKTTADYNTGTVAVNKNSATVTGTLTVWTSAMAGRKIRIGSENPYYRILSVGGAGTLTLEQPYQGEDQSGVGFEIYKDEYRLAADVDKYKTMRQAQNSVALFSFHPTRFDESFPMPNSLADPICEIMTGTKLDIYTTGTVTGSSGASVLTGLGTGWLSVDGLGRMSKIKIGKDLYTVKSVDSDTQITIYESIATNAAASTYEIKLDNLIVQLYQIPNAQRLIYYRYFRIPAPLTQDTDIPDMPQSWHWVLMYGALSVVLMQKGDINKAQMEAEARFIDGLNMMKLKIGSFTPDRIYHRKSVDRPQRNMDGLEKSSFDRKYSMP